MFNDIEILRFHDSYHYASLIDRILRNRFDYLRTFDEFFCNDIHLQFAHPFAKYSVLHCFSEFVIRLALDHEVDSIDLEYRQSHLDKYRNIPAALEDLRPTTLPIEFAFEAYAIQYTTFEAWLVEQNMTFGSATSDDVAQYYDDLQTEGSFDNLLQHLTTDVFFIIFPNRQLLLLLNELFAEKIGDTFTDAQDEEHKYFQSQGILKRQSLPEWIMKAVTHRDRGMCNLCHRDVSGSLRINAEQNFDHIVPLSKGGLNDVTNIQLLCRECNQRKGNRPAVTSDYHELWYPM